MPDEFLKVKNRPLNKRDEILDEIGFEFNQGGYYQNDISDDSTDDDYDLYDEMP